MDDRGTRRVRSFCHICAPYCGIIVDADGDRIISVRGDVEHPVSRGYVCPKGRALGDLHHDARRLDHPMVRVDGRLEATTWEAALDDLAARVEAIVAETGPDAIAIYEGTPANHETIAQPALGKLLYKLGSRSRYSSLTVDIAAKLAVTPMVLGAQLLPVIDFDDTDLLLVIGTNPVVSHGQYNGISDPVTRLREVARRGEVWVVDPRRTETAAHATHHVPIRPGTDHALLAHVVRDLLARGVDHAVTDRLRNVEVLARAVAPWDLDRTSAATGIDGSTITALTESIARAGRFSLLTGTGVTMAPSANVAEWLGLAALLVSDSFDRPGGMWCNPGHTFPRDRAPLRPAAPSDGRPGPASRPDVPRFLAEHPCAALADEIDSGNVRALVSFAGNPLVAIAEPDRLRHAVGSLDVFVTIGTMRDEQTELATHVLPAAGGLERAELLLVSQSAQLRVLSQYAPAIVAPQRERRPAWWIVGQLARRLGHDVLPGKLDPDTATDDDLLAAMVGDRAVFDAMIAADGPLVGDDRITDWALDRLPAAPDLAPAALVDQLTGLTKAPLPGSDELRLIPRRRLRRFNSVASDRTPADDQEILIHVDTAARLGVESGEAVRVSSAHGQLVGPVAVTEHIDPAVVAISHGYPDVHVGRLTSARHDIDPISGQITQTGIPVTIEPA